MGIDISALKVSEMEHTRLLRQFILNVVYR